MAKDLVTKADLKLPLSIRKRLTTDEKLDLILTRLDGIDMELLKLRNDLAVTFNDEFSNQRHELSQALADKMRQRLAGEEAARAVYGPGVIENKADE